MNFVWNILLRRYYYENGPGLSPAWQIREWESGRVGLVARQIDSSNKLERGDPSLLRVIHEPPSLVKSEWQGAGHTVRAWVRILFSNLLPLTSLTALTALQPGSWLCIHGCKWSSHRGLILASDWLRVIMWPGYWPLIGWDWSQVKSSQTYKSNTNNSKVCPMSHL